MKGLTPVSPSSSLARLLGLLVLCGFAHGLDLGIGLGSDALYKVGDDTSIRPVVVYANADFGLHGAVGIRVQAGYSSYLNTDWDLAGTTVQRRTLQGAEVGALPFYRLCTPLSWLSVLGGAGIAFSYHWLRATSQRFEPNGAPDLYANRDLLGGTLMLHAEADLDLPSRLALQFGVERPGFRVAYDGTKLFISLPEMPAVLEDKWLVTSGWDGKAQTGVGVAILLRL